MTDGAYISDGRDGFKESRKDMNSGKDLQNIDGDGMPRLKLVQRLHETNPPPGKYITGYFRFPKWVPDGVQLAAKKLWPFVKDADIEIFQRLLCDRRMYFVWKELLCRGSGSERFRYPVVGAEDSEQSQHKALGLLFYVAFYAMKDDMRVYLASEVQAAREEAIGKALASRRFADDMAAAAWHDPQIKEYADAAARFAFNKEQVTKNLMNETDVRVVRRMRGDPLVRGVAIIIAIETLKLFDRPMTATIATLTSVATGMTCSRQQADSAATYARYLKLDSLR
jgi:hypothetical protein